MSECSNSGCEDPCCDGVDDGARCVNEQCPSCGNSVASIGGQLAQAYRDGYSDGIKAPRRRSRQTSWKAIATALGNAMQTHAFCEDHPATNPEPECPFCEDRAVFARYRRFAEKHRMTFPDPLKGLESICIYDLRREPQP